MFIILIYTTNKYRTHIRDEYETALYIHTRVYLCPYILYWLMTARQRGGYSSAVLFVRHNLGHVGRIDHDLQIDHLGPRTCRYDEVLCRICMAQI